MRTEQPKMIKLTEYRLPDYLIDETHLTFELHENYALVHARLLMQRNPGLDETLPPLILDGQQLELVDVALDGRHLTAVEYQLSDSHLQVQPTHSSFEFTSTVRIEPQNNTALEGLYKSSGMFCTQCEAEGFRKITYYLDRPDVMSRFTTTIHAEKQRYPVLLSNGNPIAEGEGENGRHWMTWQDPFKKPAYLFAVVAGDLLRVDDSFITMSGREVALRIFVEPENIDKCQHAMDSLKNAMRWDEEVYGREYDLDIFMIVAVNDFNMGAMENKGLNIFNSSCVLAKAETATDAAHQRVEAVVAHEYFHNWSGNRVTCRDWFQLSLKEGFTVFRDSEFSADMNSRVVTRIEGVAYLRTHQFAEDAGPMAHPVRPEQYMEISNFYTLTIYEKGAEVVRMLHTLLGAETFRKGSDLYFERHDGQAVTCDDFIAAMESVSGMDLTQFKRWYSQAGTPQLSVSDSYDAATQTYQLHVKQSCPDTPEQRNKQPFVIPLSMALLNQQGESLPLQLHGESAAVLGERVLAVTEAEQSFSFIKVPEKPLPSLLRGFSAPVQLDYAYSRDDLLFLLQHDTDGFNRWEAGQQLALQVIEEVVGQLYETDEPMLDTRLVEVFSALLAQEDLDPAMLAEFIALPSTGYIIEQYEQADPLAIHQAREYVSNQLAFALKEPMLARYQALRKVSLQTPYVAQASDFARRRLQNMLLAYLMRTEDLEILDACVDQFGVADNMTERLAALACLVNSPFTDEAEHALASFAERFEDDPLVMDQWFSVQAAAALPDGLERVEHLLKHPAFSIKNPNKVRAVVGAFTQNTPNFHAIDGSGYAFLADKVIKLDALNPQMAARMLSPLTRWQRFDLHQQEMMQSQLQRVRGSGDLSADLFEVLEKSLAV
ncbi:MAG: aminopeptidase N [Gammaproteobacteria bacterium]|jgi:aminopeptidase N|nr:aminopeptidase N [Pseudomonas sp.]NLO54473.1 aminopeptidase N [Gammaproteobacteria bacterium]